MDATQTLAKLLNDVVFPEVARRRTPLEDIPPALVAMLASEITEGRATFKTARQAFIFGLDLCSRPA